MAWSASRPNSASTPSATVQDVLDNWIWIDASLSAEHIFPGVSGSTAGNHLLGECAMVNRDTFDNMSGSPTRYGLYYATDRYKFYGCSAVADGLMELRAIPSGTNMLFYQTAAPSGFTIVTTYNDYAVMITDSVLSATMSGGTWTLQGLHTDSHTHTYTQIPLHTHTDEYEFGGSPIIPGAPFYSTLLGNVSRTASATVEGGVATGTTNAASSDVSGNALWRPAYAAVLMCVKD